MAARRARKLWLLAGALVGVALHAGVVGLTAHLPWRWSLLNFVCLASLVLPPCGLVAAVLLRRGRRAAATAVAVAAAAVLVVGAGVSVFLFAVRRALTSEVVVLSADSAQSKAHFRETVVPILGRLPARDIRVEHHRGPRVGFTNVTFRIEDIAALKRALEENGWTHDGVWYVKKAYGRHNYLLGYSRAEDGWCLVDLQEPF